LAEIVIDFRRIERGVLIDTGKKRGFCRRFV